VYSEQDERVYLSKYAEAVKGMQESLEAALSLYDEEENGLITVQDLREGLAQADVREGKDRKAFDCIAVYFLRKNNSTEMVRIEDVMREFFKGQERGKEVRKSGIQDDYEEDEYEDDEFV